jgi:hypothetical protein
MKLIQLVGFKDPIVLDKDNVIWAGHGRLEAAKRLDMKEVKCMHLEDLTETQKKIFMLMDNKINESPWDYDRFKEVFDAVSPTLADDFSMNFEELIEYSTRPDPKDWAEAFKNETVLSDSIQITFNVPVEHETAFKEYLKTVDPKSKDNALMKMYKYCQKNMK